MEGEDEDKEGKLANGGPNHKFRSLNNNNEKDESPVDWEREKSGTGSGIRSPAESSGRTSARRKKHHHRNKREQLHVQFNEESSNSSRSESSESSSDESSLEHLAAHAPDGGWGWVVVAASFFVNLIADGITFSFGVIFVEFLNYFGEAKSKTAWIGSLFMAMPLLSGPVASFLTDRFGCRRVAIFGAILAALGFIISSFTSSIEVLFLTFGVFAGFGLSLCYVAAVVIVAYYFDRRRSFATGLSVCGSGIGTFIFAPLTQWLLGEYGWRGTTLILAGLFLNMCVCGALMRDLPWTRARSIENRRKRSQNRSGSSTKSLRTATSSAESVPGGGQWAESLALSGAPPPEPRISTSLVNIPTFVRSGEKVPLEVLELLTAHRNMYSCLVANYPSLLIASRSCSDSGLALEGAHRPRPLPLSPLATGEGGGGEGRGSHHPSAAAKRLAPAYLKDLRVHRHSLTYRGAMLNINRYRLRASSCPDIYRNSMTTIAKEKHEWYSGLVELWYLVLDMLDLSFFLDIHFLLFAVSNFLLYTWYDVPYVYLADNAIKMGFSETDASYLISVIGILNMVGEILLGYAGDIPWINPHLVYAVSMFLCGAVTALVPLLPSYISLCAASGAFGLFIAANYSLTSIILVELITIERFTNAYGLLLLVQGVANLIGPPLAGYLYDVTNSYDLSFYLAGVFIAMSGLMLLILPGLEGLRGRRKGRDTPPDTPSEAEAWGNKTLV